MATRRTPNWEQALAFNAATEQRVINLEHVVTDIRGAISDLSKKMDTKPTSVWIIMSSLGGILAVVGVAIGLLLAPRDASIERHEHEIGKIADTALTRDDYFRNHETLVQQVKDLNAALIEQVKEQDARYDRWNSSLRDRLTADEKSAVAQDNSNRETYASEKQIAELEKTLQERQDGNRVWLDRLMNRIDAVDSQLVKRPELQAALDSVKSAIQAAQENNTARINTLGSGLHELQTQVQAVFPPNHALEQMEREISELRQRGLPAPVGAAR